ncbi:MAG TPA: FG-GAP-like repeat-containing protein, partial [Puia sp.]|nr:FG-GAP-like repeat-containing protein [Puia sp.]
GSQILSRELVPSRGFQSSVDYKVIIGLGATSTIDSMTITWPDHSLSRFQHPLADTLHIIQEPPPSASPDAMATATSRRQARTITVHPNSAHPATQPDATTAPNVATMLQTIASSFDQHREDSYTDFHTEHNLPKILSREGPRAAVGDVNGDGLPDIYIGGASGQAGQLYLQTPSGAFVKHPEKAFDQFADFEDVAVLLFDCDHDGDLDLLVCPGGNNAPSLSRQMQLRLYRNDGKGNFGIDPSAFPNTGMNISVAITDDFNGDGYPDLFIGGRSTPQNYGLPPSSYLFVNDGHGHFTDIAPAKNPDIAHIGMVTGAVFTPVTGGRQKDLVITGEWMSPKIFSWAGDHFAEVRTNLSNLSGWWQTVGSADLNGDGRPDLILGNIGENFYLHPDSTHPVRLWINDFDQNGIPDKIMTRTVDGKDMPVFLKHDMEIQIPSLKKQNLKHGDFAKRPIQELFPQKMLDSSLVRQFNYAPSIIAINEGNGRFSIRPMPTMVQLSSVNAIHCMDLNGDGFPDLVLGGNESGFLPQFGRLDASFGHILLNDGKGNFTWIGPERSGLELRGQIRDIAEIRNKDHLYLLFLQNDEYPVLYDCRPQK